MSTTFFCNLSLPVLVGEDRYRYLPVVAVFRSIPVSYTHLTLPTTPYV